MDLHRPKRLLGLFGKRYSSTQQLPKEHPPDDHHDESSQSDDVSSTSPYNIDEAAIRRLTEQRDIVTEVLRTTKEGLEKEKKLTNELNQRLIMKAISIDCQLAEQEERFNEAKYEIDVANRKNSELTDQLSAVRLESQNLMKRCAALARRDQIQKATILASNSEIIKLVSTVESLQYRFMTLHDAVETHKGKYNETKTEHEVSVDKPTGIESETESGTTLPLNLSSEDDSLSPFEEDQMNLAKLEEFEAKQVEFRAQQEEFKAQQDHHRKVQEEWHVERDNLFAFIAKLKKNNKEIKNKFVQTLKKHQWKWHKEKEKFQKKEGDLEVRLKKKEAELTMTKNILADAIARGKQCLTKGGLEHADTFTTLTFQEDSLSTCSSTSLTIAHSLTQTTNNTYDYKIKSDETQDFFKLVENDSDSTSDSLKYDSEISSKDNTSSNIFEPNENDRISFTEPPKHCIGTPSKRSNGPSKRDDPEPPKQNIGTPLRSKVMNSN